MKVYHYNPKTKEYTGESKAKVDQLESQRHEKIVYLTPSCATKVSPPEVGENQKAVFNEIGWDTVEDNRGKIVYDKDNNYRQVKIKSLGKLPANLVESIPEKTAKEISQEEEEAKQKEIDDAIITETAKRNRELSIQSLKDKGELEEVEGALKKKESKS